MVNTLKDMAVCFFRICEAAKIGTLFIGRRGQSTRLDLNRDLLGQYIGNSALTSSISKANDEGEELESVDNALWKAKASKHLWPPKHQCRQ